MVPDIYLTGAEFAELTRLTQGRRNSVGGQASVAVAFPGLRLLPSPDGTYDRWILQELAKLRGVELREGEAVR